MFDFIRKKLNPLKYARKKGVIIGTNTHILGQIEWGSEPWLIEIGNDTTFSGHIKFFTHDGGWRVPRRLNKKYSKVLKFGKVKIGNNCFIGYGATFLPDVVVGDNCIIGAMSLVTKDVPSGEVWGGNPAKKICTIEEYAEKLLLNIPDYDTDELHKNKKLVSIKIAEHYSVKRRKK